jgi:TolB-like protein/Flp pilus assembly protein TadD
MSLVAELRRRNVFRVAAAYLVVGWLLTEVLTTILPTLGAPEWTSRAVILIFALGFIPAVVISWFFELTPEGIKREEDVQRHETGSKRFGRKLDYVTVVGVVILIVFVGLFSARQTGDDSAPAVLAVNDASVAVLPFANMSNDPDNEYFSDGLTETLLHMLAQIPDLQVAARTSSFAFKGQNINVREIAAALGVAHILEGSVQRAGDQVRITAQLIRADDGFHVWSEVYDRTVDDIFTTQDEIARKVGYALTESLLGAEEAPVAGVDTADPDAYDLYLQAREAGATFSYGGLKAAEDLLKGALLIDPDFVDAKIELATGYIQQFETGLMDPRAALNEIRVIMAQVLEARPDDPVARATQIYAAAYDRMISGDFGAMGDAAAELKQIVQDHPGELRPRLLLARTYSQHFQNEAAIPVLEAALESDPYNPRVLYELGAVNFGLQNWEQARESLVRSLELNPQQPNAYIYLARISLQEGDGVEYVRRFFQAVEVDPEDHEVPGLLAVFLYQLDLVEQGDDLHKRVQALAPTSEIAYRLDLVRAIAVGDEEAASAAARRAIVDDIDERQESWAGALRYLLLKAIDDGRAEEEMAWLESQVPGIFEVEGEAVPQKHRMAQGLALNSWYASLPRTEALEKVDRFLATMEGLGFEPMEEPTIAWNVHAMRGEIEAAVDIALEGIFSQSVAVNRNWRQSAILPQFADVLADERVQAALQRWEDEENALREDVRAYLEDLQAAS